MKYGLSYAALISIQHHIQCPREPYERLRDVDERLFQPRPFLNRMTSKTVSKVSVPVSRHLGINPQPCLLDTFNMILL